MSGNSRGQIAVSDPPRSCHSARTLHFNAPLTSDGYVLDSMLEILPYGDVNSFGTPEFQPWGKKCLCHISHVILVCFSYVVTSLYMQKIFDQLRVNPKNKEYFSTVWISATSKTISLDFHHHILPCRKS